MNKIKIDIPNQIEAFSEFKNESKDTINYYKVQNVFVNKNYYKGLDNKISLSKKYNLEIFNKNEEK